MAAAFDHLDFPSADGRLRLYARDYPGGGPAVLMMHGLTRNSADFEGLAARLAGRFRLVVPDQRGRGRSDADPDPARYGLDSYCADVRGLIGRLGLALPVLLGTSMGGLMAMRLAAETPHGFAGLVLNDVGPVVEAAGLQRIAGYVGLPAAAADWDAAADYCRRTNGAAFPGYGKDQWRIFARRLFTSDGAGALRLAYDPAIAGALAAPPAAEPPADPWALWNALASLPILAVRGALSDVLSAKTLARMQTTHPGLAVCVVPDVGHAPMLDEPAAVSAIEAFLARLPAASPDVR